MQMEKNAILDYLKTDPAFDPNMASMSLMELIDVMIDKMADLELDYEILSTAFASKVHPDRFEQFHDAVMSQYDMIREGEEISEPTLDRIASNYK